MAGGRADHSVEDYLAPVILPDAPRVRDGRDAVERAQVPEVRVHVDPAVTVEDLQADEVGGLGQRPRCPDDGGPLAAVMRAELPARVELPRLGPPLLILRDRRADPDAVEDLGHRRVLERGRIVALDLDGLFGCLAGHRLGLVARPAAVPPLPLQADDLAEDFFPGKLISGL